MARGKDVHVVFNKKDKVWQIKHAKNVLDKYRTQKEAFANAVKYAKKQKLELSVHNKNGKIKIKNSYGNDPKKIKG